ncbi:MAG: hypothetical protein AAF610_02860 [Pseudomonadota bacterium]
MNKRHNIALGIALALTMHASALVIDLDDAGPAGTQARIDVLSAHAGEVLSPSFDFVYEVGTGATAHQMHIAQIPAAEFVRIGTAEGACASFNTLCTFDLGLADASDVYSASGEIEFASSIIEGSGDWEMLISESFDHPGIDGVFLDDAMIEIDQVQMPIPATLLMAGLGLAGMGILRWRR